MIFRPVSTTAKALSLPISYFRRFAKVFSANANLSKLPVLHCQSFPLYGIHFHGCMCCWICWLIVHVFIVTTIRSTTRSCTWSFHHKQCPDSGLATYLLAKRGERNSKVCPLLCLVIALKVCCSLCLLLYQCAYCFAVQLSRSSVDGWLVGWSFNVIWLYLVGLVCLSFATQWEGLLLTVQLLVSPLGPGLSRTRLTHLASAAASLVQWSRGRVGPDVVLCM